MNRALLVIDVQNEYFTGKLPVSHPPGSLENILSAMDAAQTKGILTVVVRHYSPLPDSPVFRLDSLEWALHPEVAARSRDLLLDKQVPGSFTDTLLEEWLRERDVETVVISGYMTQMCCDSTARQAWHRGFKVEFLGDATGTLDIANYAGKISAEELHRAVLVTQAMRFAQVLSTEQWIKSL